MRVNPSRAAQVLVVRLLDPVGADARALLDAAVAVLLELVGRDLARGAEELGGELVVRVVAQVALGDLDARELLAALADEVERDAIDGGADRDVRVRRLGDALDHALVDRLRPHVDHAPEPPVEAAQLRLLGRDRRDRHRRRALGLAAQLAALAALRPGGVAAAVADVALERAQAGSRGEPRVLGHPARLAELVGLLEHAVGQRAGLDLDDGRHARLHQHPAVAVDDVAARRLDDLLADLVLAGDRHVVLAGEHLQEPEAEEHDAEDDERDAAEHGDAHRELRRDRGPALLERVLRHQARESGLRPPVVYARRRRRRGSSGRYGASQRRQTT